MSVTAPTAGRGWIASLLLLFGCLAAGATLRFESLREPSLWLDEILGFDLTTAAMSRPWWSWIIGFDPEHGPLYYLTQIAGRIAPSPELAVRWLPALFGVVAIWLVWLSGRLAWNGFTAAAASAAILATSPLHVYYSREGRPYSLAVLLATGILIALLRRSWTLYPLIAAALYTSAIAAPVIIAAGAAALASGWLQTDETERRRDWTAAAFAAAATGIVPWLYRGYAGSKTGVNFPEVSASFLDSLVRSFAVTAIGSDERGRTAILVLVLAIIGAISLAIRNRRAAAIVVVMALLPVVITLLALQFTNHWFAIRYVTPALPAYVVLAGSGIAAIARLLTQRLRYGWVFEWVVATAFIGAIWLHTIPAARYEPYQKLDWRGVASRIWNHAQPGDRIVTAEGWSTVSLGFYLRRLPPRAEWNEVTDPAVAERLVSNDRRVWFVTAGHTNDSRVRDWMCRYPIVLSSGLENLRVHYAPGASDFLRARSTPPERRTVMGGDSLTLDMRRGDDLFLSDDWATAEGTGGDSFRWVQGDRATVTLPLIGQTDRHLRLTLSPLEHETLPPQIMTVSINRATIGKVVLQNGVNDYDFAVPANTWRSDGANVMEIGFSRANAPSQFDPSSTDDRLLSAAFHEISVTGEDRGARATPPALRTIRLLSNGPLLDENTIWREAESDFPNLDRQSIDALLTRLGFDPEATASRVMSGVLPIERLVETVAWFSACEDDRVFIRRAWLTIFGREPNPVEEQVLLRLLEEEGTRVNLMNRISRMSEFRAAISSRASQ